VGRIRRWTVNGGVLVREWVREEMIVMKGLEVGVGGRGM